MKKSLTVLVFSLTLSAIVCCQHQQGSTIVVKILNQKIDKSKIKIEVEASNNEKIVLWESGSAKKTVPNYGVEGVKWLISYDNDILGEFVHGKLIMNEPLKYSFIFNCDKESILFAQVNIPSKGTNFSERFKQKSGKKI